MLQVLESTPPSKNLGRDTSESISYFFIEILGNPEF
jgi:hypothetical protein